MKEIKDPAKLKVVELRAELSARGLDTKGNKPVLVSRLREALEAEGDEVPADTSIQDTSTEDLDSSQPAAASPECILPEDASSDSVPLNTNESPETVVPDDDPLEASQSSVIVRPSSDSPSSLTKEEMEIETKTEESKKESESYRTETNGENEHQLAGEFNAEDDDIELKLEDDGDEEADKIEDSMEVDDAKDIKDDAPEPRAKKSRWGSVKQEKKETVEAVDESSNDARASKHDSKEARNENRDMKDTKEREKRRRSPSPRRRSRSPRKPDDEPEINANDVLLSWNDSDLQLEISKENFYSAHINKELPLTGLWAGARATYGVKDKKVWYEVKLISNSKPRDVLKDEKNPYLLRVGWSVIESPLQLGETNKSYGYDASGYKATDNIFERYGRKFREGDVVASFIDLESDPVAVSFAVNGVNQGVAFNIPKEELGEDALFPHIVTKNVSYEVNFGQREEGPWFEPSDQQADEDEEDEESEDENPKQSEAESKENGEEDKMDVTENKEKSETEEKEKVEDDSEKIDEDNKDEEETEEKKESEETPQPVEVKEVEKEKKCILGWLPLNDGYVLIGTLDKEERVPGLERFAKREDCEIIMMCGLPSSGKTHWVQNWLAEHPEKHYTILGTSQLVNMMTVSGKPRKDNHTGRWDVLLDKCNRTINQLLELACLRRRNYILDQTNIFPSAQRRKMRSFEGFQRRAVVIVPSEEEYAKRQAKRAQTDGKDVPDSAVLEMKANMSLPEKGDPFIEITFPELSETEARALVERYNEEGRKAGYGPQYSCKRPRAEWNDRRSGSSWSRHGSGGSKSKRNDSRSGGNRWSHNQRSGGGHGSDRRHGGGGSWGGSGGGGRWGGPGGRNGPPPLSRGGHMGGGWGNNMGGGNRQGGGGSYNRNQGGGGSGGFNRRGGPPSGGGGSRNQQRQGNWGGSQNSWGSGWGNQNAGGGGGPWGQGGNASGGGQGSNWAPYGNSANQWKGYQNQQGALTSSNSSGAQGSQGNQGGNAAAQSWVGYPGYGWGNYYGQYAQGWGAQGQQGAGTGANQMYNQYSQQWAQYAQQASYGGYTTTTSQQSGGKKDDKKT